MINTSSELWEILQKQGGLNVKDPFYDKQIIEDLATQLGLDSSISIQKQLKKEYISVEDFLYAFFKSVEPFSMMMSDLLSLFEQIGVKHSNSNLCISFDFSKKENGLTFDLEHFKNWTKRWEIINKTYLVNNWSYNSLWNLNSVFRDLAQLYGSQENIELKKWNFEYGELRTWPDKLPDLPIISYAKFDDAIRKVWRLVDTVYRESRSYGKSRNVLRDLKNGNNTNEIESIDTLWPAELLRGLDSDLWINSLIAGIFGVIEKVNVNALNNTVFADKVIAEVEAVYSGLDTTKETVETEAEILESFLDLPIWKKRHELYSVWVSTQIISAIGLDELDIHCNGDTLIFSFAGTHFATTRSFEQILHLWAELRSPLANPIGKSRLASIQPDYTILRNPITSEDSAILVVECKQYKKQSKRNFCEALLDYANARMNATVILVNYGPITGNLLDEPVLADVRKRIDAIGDMHPKNKVSIERFKELTRKTLGIKQRVFSASTPKAETKLSGQDRIVLHWGNSPKDIDLHLKIIPVNDNPIEISFSNVGKPEEFPFCELSSDKREGFGPEELKITRYIEGQYIFYIHNYSKDGSLAQCGAFVDIELKGQSIRLNCPNIGEGDYWRLMQYDSKSEILTIVNEIIPTPY